MCNATDAIPSWVQAEAGNSFDNLKCTLAVGKSEEHWRHRANVLNVGAEEEQVTSDTEELGHHDADDVDLLRHLDAG